MAVKIRLTRMGAKKHPSYRIVATDSRRKRDGEYLEQIGFYDPIQNEVRVDQELALKLLNDVAKPSDTVRNIFSQNGIMSKYASSKQGK